MDPEFNTENQNGLLPSPESQILEGQGEIKNLKKNLSKKIKDSKKAFDSSFQIIFDSHQDLGKFICLFKELISEASIALLKEPKNSFSNPEFKEKDRTQIQEILESISKIKIKNDKSISESSDKSDIQQTIREALRLKLSGTNLVQEVQKSQNPVSKPPITETVSEKRIEKSSPKTNFFIPFERRKCSLGESPILQKEPEALNPRAVEMKANKSPENDISKMIEEVLLNQGRTWQRTESAEKKLRALKEINGDVVVEDHENIDSIKQSRPVRSSSTKKGSIKIKKNQDSSNQKKIDFTPAISIKTKSIAASNESPILTAKLQPVKAMNQNFNTPEYNSTWKNGEKPKLNIKARFPKGIQSKNISAFSKTPSSKFFKSNCQDSKEGVISDTTSHSLSSHEKESLENKSPSIKDDMSLKLKSDSFTSLKERLTLHQKSALSKRGLVSSRKSVQVWRSTQQSPRQPSTEKLKFSSQRNDASSNSLKISVKKKKLSLSIPSSGAQDRNDKIRLKLDNNLIIQNQSTSQKLQTSDAGSKVGSHIGSPAEYISIGERKTCPSHIIMPLHNQEFKKAPRVQISQGREKVPCSGKIAITKVKLSGGRSWIFKNKEDQGLERESPQTQTTSQQIHLNPANKTNSSKVIQRPGVSPIPPSQDIKRRKDKDTFKNNILYVKGSRDEVLKKTNSSIRENLKLIGLRSEPVSLSELRTDKK